ncbi:unnamed protein product [Lathyrus sativus]|nr:unnamed protein product [Lathyrus sativus]
MSIGKLNLVKRLKRAYLLKLLVSQYCHTILATLQVDRLYGWKTCRNAPIRKAMLQQSKDVQNEFNRRLDQILSNESSHQTIARGVILDTSKNHISVSFSKLLKILGEAAKNLAAVNPERTIFDVKRLIGRKFEDKEVQRDMKLVPYKIVNKDGKPYIQVKIKDGETKVFSPEEVSAMILTKMKETAEAFLGKTIRDAVVTVPGE